MLDRYYLSKLAWETERCPVSSLLGGKANKTVLGFQIKIFSRNIWSHAFDPTITACFVIFHSFSCTPRRTPTESAHNVTGKLNNLEEPKLRRTGSANA